MESFIIGTVEHQRCGELKICFHGPNKMLTFEQELPGGGQRSANVGLVPTSLLNALEIVEKAFNARKNPNAFVNLKLFDFDRAELREEELRIAQLKTQSKHRAFDVGAPMVSELIELFENLIEQDPMIAQFPVYFAGGDWYLHVDGKDLCVIMDEEMLYEEYELEP